MPISEVYNMDCMDYMKSIPDKFFDLAVVDPPYGIGADKPSIKPCLVKQKNGTILPIKQPGYIHKNWDDQIPDDSYFEELQRVSKNQIIFGANYFPRLSGGMIVWDKLNGDTDQYGCEIAYQSFNQRTDILYYMWRGMIQGACCSKNIQKAIIQQGDKTKNEKRIHPTQKPIPLYHWIFKNYANPGDKILDTHLGSGSSRIAAYKLGFDFYATEIDMEYFEAQEERFRRECHGEIKTEKGTLVQTSLFGV